VVVIANTGVVTVTAVSAGFNIHQPGELPRLPVRVAPIVRRFGKSVVKAATSNC
jgi:hypothetical protein